MPVLRLYKEGRPAKRLSGHVNGGICSLCGGLPDDEQARGVAEFQKQRASGQYYNVSRAVETYRNVVEGGITVAELITRLQALNSGGLCDLPLQ